MHALKVRARAIHLVLGHLARHVVHGAAAVVAARRPPERRRQRRVFPEPDQVHPLPALRDPPFRVVHARVHVVPDVFELFQDDLKRRAVVQGDQPLDVFEEKRGRLPRAQHSRDLPEQLPARVLEPFPLPALTERLARKPPGEDVVRRDDILAHVRDVPHDQRRRRVADFDDVVRRVGASRVRAHLGREHDGPSQRPKRDPEPADAGEELRERERREFRDRDPSVSVSGPGPGPGPGRRSFGADDNARERVVRLGLPPRRSHPAAPSSPRAREGFLVPPLSNHAPRLVRRDRRRPRPERAVGVVAAFCRAVVRVPVDVTRRVSQPHVSHERGLAGRREREKLGELGAGVERRERVHGPRRRGGRMRILGSSIRAPIRVVPSARVPHPRVEPRDAVALQSARPLERGSDFLHRVRAIAHVRAHGHARAVLLRPVVVVRGRRVRARRPPRLPAPREELRLVRAGGVTTRRRGGRGLDRRPRDRRHRHPRRRPHASRPLARESNRLRIVRSETESDAFSPVLSVHSSNDLARDIRSTTPTPTPTPPRARPSRSRRRHRPPPPPATAS
eukprot:31333-Pelagococcus_subviridis.AAC.20